MLLIVKDLHQGFGSKPCMCFTERCVTLFVWSHYKLLQVNKILSYSVLHLKKN